MSKISIGELKPIMDANISREAQLMTEGAIYYRTLGQDYAGHHTVNHTQGECVNKDNREIYTNTVENYFSLYK